MKYNWKHWFFNKENYTGKEDTNNQLKFSINNVDGEFLWLIFKTKVIIGKQQYYKVICHVK